MAKIKISQEEIEKMLKDQLGIDEVKWDKNGNANVELDLDKIKEKEEIIKKEEHHHYHDHYKYWPTIYTTTPSKKYGPYWYVTNTNKTSGISTTGTLSYCSTK